MELIVIGCDGSYPAAHGACSGFLVQADDGSTVLLDCGSGGLGKLMALMDPAKLSAVMITHWHSDHAADLLTLRHYLLIHKKRLPLYAPLDSSLLMQLCEHEEFVLKDIAQASEVGGMMMETTPVVHAMEAFAVKLVCDGKQLVYTGDTDRWENLASFCRGADLLVCDATFTSEEWNEQMPHLSSSQAAVLAREAEVKQLLLTHFPPTGDGVTLLKQAKEVFANCLAAKPGLRIQV